MAVSILCRRFHAHVAVTTSQMAGCLWPPNNGSLATTVSRLVSKPSAYHKMRMNEQTSEEFDWSPLGEAFWLEAQKTVGASDLQTKFAACRYRGMTAVGSAKAAGYTGDAAALRQAGSRAAQGTAVQHLMALGKAEARGDDNGHVGLEEARRILSRLARGSDPNVRIKALDSLSKLDRDERANRPQEPAEDPGELIMWFKGLFEFAFVSSKASNIEFADLWRAVVVRIGDRVSAPAGNRPPGGNGAQQAPETAEEASNAAA